MQADRRRWWVIAKVLTMEESLTSIIGCKFIVAFPKLCYLHILLGVEPTVVLEGKNTKELRQQMLFAYQ